MRRPASSSTGRSTASISANCSGPAISGGASWITGSPRSSERQIRPRLEHLARQVPAEQGLGLLVAERLLGLLVLDELDRVEVTEATNVTDDREVPQRLEHPEERALMFTYVAEDVLVLKDIEVRQRDGRGDRVTAPGGAVQERLGALHERLGYAVGSDHGAHRRVCAGRGPWRW